MDDSSPTTTELPERKNRLSSSGIKRNKVSRACDECRKRKVRCDGAQPCARCQKSSTECIFSNVTPKRGPPKQYIEPFESRLKAIEKILDVLELSDLDHQKNTEFLNKNEYTRPVESNNNNNNNHSRLDVTLVGQALYIPDYPARLDRVEPIYSTINILNSPLDLPSFPIRLDLIQSYFEHIHPFIPFLHRDTFEHTLQTSKPPALLLNAMYAVASYWSSSQKKKVGDSNHASSNDHIPGFSFYKTAIGLIDKCTDAPRLSTVQALMLLVKYHEFLHRPGFFWRTKILLQLAIQISKDLGLSREIPQTLQDSSIQGELQRRTFWVVYTFEILTSTEQGLEPYFREEQCTVEYPHVLADESVNDSNAVLNFYWLSKVIHVLGAVLQFVRTKYNGKEENKNWSKEEVFSKIEKRLEELGANIPGIVESDIGTSYYHLVYHSAVILLYRPYAMECINNDGNLVQSQYLAKCLNSSCMITDIVNHLLNSRGTEGLFGLVKGVQQIVYYLTVAITVQRSIVMDHPNQLIDPSLSEKLDQSTTMLQVLILHSPVTELEANNPPPSLTDPCYYWSDKPEFQMVSPSNTSSTRSSPLIPQLHSPHSPSVSSQQVRKRLSRSSCNFTSPDVPFVMQSSSVFVPDLNQHRMQPRSPYASNRLSAPALGSMYQPPYIHQQQQQQQQKQSHIQPQPGMSSYSQPSSPTTSQFGAADTYNGNASGGGGGSGSGSGSGSNPVYPPVTPRRTTSLSRKQGLRRSASSAGEFVVPSQRPNRTTSRPYIVNPRRHTLSNSTPPDLSNMLPTNAPSTPGFSRHLHAMAVRNNRFSAPVLTNTQLPYTIPFSTQQQMHQPQQQQFNQHAMVLDPSFPMDPVIPDSPNESMMGLLLNPWDFSSPPPPQ